MHVFLETNPFQAHEPQYFNGGSATLSTPTNFTPQLVQSAMTILERIYRPDSVTKKWV